MDFTQRETVQVEGDHWVVKDKMQPGEVFRFLQNKTLLPDGRIRNRMVVFRVSNNGRSATWVGWGIEPTEATKAEANARVMASVN